MSNWKYICISVFMSLMMNANSAQGQSELDIREFTVEDGLAENNPTQIVQDKTGFIWVSTWNGLCRYDGYSFVTFTFDVPEPGYFFKNRMIRMLADGYGNIWFLGNNYRVYRFNTLTKEFSDMMTPYDRQRALPYQAKDVCYMPKGVVWILLKGGGGLRYDVKDGTSSMFKSSEISMIKQDRCGNEWVMTDHHVSAYGRHEGLCYQFSYMVPIGDKVYFASRDGKMAEYANAEKKFRFIKLPSAIRDISRLDALRGNRMMISTDAGLFVFDAVHHTIRLYDIHDASHRSYVISKVYQDKEGDVWIFTGDDGVVRINLKNNEVQHLDSRKLLLKYNPSIFKFHDNLIFEDKFGKLWVSPHGEVLARYDRSNRTLVPFVNGNDAAYNMLVKDFYVDRQKSLWVISQNKIIKMTAIPKRYSFVPLDENIDTKAFMRDSYGNLWVSTKAGVVRIFDRHYVLKGFLSHDGTITAQAESLCKHGTYCMYKVSDGRILIGTRGDGLYVFSPLDKERFKVDRYRYNPSDAYSLNCDHVFNIVQDSYGHLWIATYGGGLNLVQMQAGGKMRFINANNELKNYPVSVAGNVRFVTCAGNGVMLAATTNGLLTFHSRFSLPECIRFYFNTHKQGDAHTLLSSDITSILCRRNGDVLICGYGESINKVASGSLLSDNIHFDLYGGSPSNSIVTMTEDRHHDLWACSEYDLRKFNGSVNGRFGKDFFKHPFIFNECTPFVSDNGDVLFGCVGGILIINPGKMIKDDYNPNIVITGIRHNADNSMEPLNNPNSIEVQPQQRNFTLSFAALDYSNSSDIEYAYKINGGDWNFIGKNHSASFVNLAAGDYKFYVKSTNGEGVWNSTPRIIGIRVLPTFWESGWGTSLKFLLFVLLAFLIGLVLSYIYRLRNKVAVEKNMADIKIKFFIDISHELRTPLTLITGPLSEVINHEPLSRVAKNHLQLVQRNVNRMLQLVNQILDFRKIQKGRMALTLQRVDVVSLLRDVMKNFGVLASEKRMRFTLESDSSDVWMLTDVDKFKKIIFNLISNAFKYTPEGKSITIMVEDRGEKVCIKVADEGVGIEKDKMNMIFDRFTSMPRIDDMQPSSGIGLSLVSELVRMLHGEISVVSERGSGSVFSVVLPNGIDAFHRDNDVEILSDDAEQNGDDDAEDIPGAVEDHAASYRILVVEDNEELRRFICDILSAFYTMDEAADGVEALEKINSVAPDFIITDIMMPRMDGFELIHHVKEDISISDIPIVVLSAKTSTDDRIQGLDLGVDDYIVKPFSADYLKSRIANLIRQRKMLQKSILAKFYNIDSREPVTGGVPSIYNNVPPQLTAIDKRFMQRLAEFLELKYSDSNLRIDDLAEYCNMSRSTFHRKISSVLGITPNEYIWKYRFHKSLEMLRGDKTFTEIAIDVGFVDSRYFGKAFKKETGLTLTEYRKKLL